MTTAEIYNQIKKNFDLFQENHIKYQERGIRTAAQRARRALNEIKKLSTLYRDNSIQQTQQKQEI